MTRQLTDAEAQRAAEVFTTHQVFIEAVAGQHAFDQNHVPDIVQAVAFKICKGLNGFRSEAMVRTWVYRVTVNESRRYYSRENYQEVAKDVLLDSYGYTGSPAEQHDQAVQSMRVAALREAIQRLRPEWQDAIRNELCGQGVLYASRWTRFRARKRLRELLQGDPRVQS